MTKRLSAVTMLMLVMAAGAFLAVDPSATFEVSAGDDLQQVIDDAPPGSSILLGRGTHRGPIRVSHEVALEGQLGAELVAPVAADAVVAIAAGGVELRSLTVRGGSTGVLAREVEDVTVADVAVVGSDLHGIEVVDASAHLSRVQVSDLRHPLAQGIEIRNSDGRPDSIIEHSSVVGGQEGIVSHVSEVIVRDNMVTGTTMRGIAVTEMSDGIVTGNSVSDAAGAGLYCGDMSRCEFQDNHVASIAPGNLGRSTAGWALVATYHAVASSKGDSLDGDAGETYTSLGARIQSDTPLELGAGWGAVPQVGMAAILALLLGALVFALLEPATRRLSRYGNSGKPSPRAGAWIVPTAAVGIAVQTFHMIEHALQVYRVRMDGIPSRGGIIGPVVEAEWIHLGYNLLVLLVLGLVVVARLRGWRPLGRAALGDRLLLTAVAIQGYHSIEHVAKVVQHVQTGAKVNEGFAGNFVDLVLFHFGINLAVYVAVVAAAVAYAPRRTRSTRLAPYEGAVAPSG